MTNITIYNLIAYSAELIVFEDIIDSDLCWHISSVVDQNHESLVELT